MSPIKFFWIFILAILFSFSVYAKENPVFTFNPQQSVHNFLISAAPSQNSTLKNFSHSIMKIQKQDILVAVYENEGGFDDAGNPLPVKNDPDNPSNRQYAFAFIKKNTSNQYIRVPVISFFDDGGSETTVLAIFKARFDKKSDPQLAFLTNWNTPMGGPYSRPESDGTVYRVTAVNLGSSLTFSEIKSPLIDKLGGCDCTVQIDDTAYSDDGMYIGKYKKEKAKARDVLGIKKQLIFMGISQS